MASVASALSRHHAMQDRIVLGGSLVAVASLVYVFYGRRGATASAAGGCGCAWARACAAQA